MHTNLIFEYQDAADAKLTSTSISLLESIVDHFRLETTIRIYETIHGHIATINSRANTYIKTDELKPRRLDPTDMEFLSQLEAIRWTEATNGSIHIAFTNYS